MKSSKIIATGLVALAAVSMASAQTTLRITGSTAFRSGTVASVKKMFVAGFDSAFTGTSDTGANFSTFVGTGSAISGVSGQPLVIQCSWTGSVEGVRDTVGGLPQSFIKTSIANTTAGADTINNVSAVTTNTAIYETFIPDVTMEDNAQSATLFTTPALYEIKVGVLPFVFVKGRVGANHPAKAAFDSITNMTGQMARTAFTGGTNISLFTGAVDATSTKLYVMGRNQLSGTRLVSFTEPGYGATSTATQFKPVVTGSVSTGTITGLDQFLDGGSGFGDGNNGYTSGGTLADELGRTVTDIDGSGNAYDGVPFGLIGYVGIGDAGRLAKNINGAVTTDVSTILSYNGVSLSPVYNTGAQAVTWNFSAITEGKYSFWSYQYLAYRKSAGPNGTVALTGTPKTVADAIAVDITANVPATAGVKLIDMKVQRASEGAPITSI